MASKDRPKPEGWEGFTTGLTCWLIFMLVFTLLRYSPFLSISFGAIAGIASAVMTDWWKSGGEGIPVKGKSELSPDEDDEESTAIVVAPRKPFGRRRRRPWATHTPARRKTRAQRRFGWVWPRGS